MKTKKLATDAMLTAMCAVLGYLSIDLGNMKITFESLPILLGAMMFGPIDGLVIGFIGTCIYQIARYGISVTTLLWIAPYAVVGFFIGYAAKKKKFELQPRTAMIMVALAEIFITLFNTLTIYVDSRIFGYYFKGYIAASLAFRFGACVIKTIVFTSLLLQILRALRNKNEATK